MITIIVQVRSRRSIKNMVSGQGAFAVVWSCSEDRRFKGKCKNRNNGEQMYGMYKIRIHKYSRAESKQSGVYREVQEKSIGKSMKTKSCVSYINGEMLIKVINRSCGKNNRLREKQN